MVRSTTKRYLSQTDKENKKLVRRLIKTGVILVIVAGAMYFWILAIFSNIDTFWNILNTGKENETPWGIDTTPPSPPFLEPLPKATNEATVNVIGYTEAGAEVRLFVNGQEYKSLVSNNEGAFTFDKVLLGPAENRIYAIATDESGNESRPSDTQIVLFDRQKPELTVIQPAQGQVFIGENDKAEVIGIGEVGAAIAVNGHLVVQDEEGRFKYLIALERSPGEKEIVVKATDAAKNETVVTITVIYHP